MTSTGLFDIQLGPHIDRHSWMAWGQGMLAGLFSQVELLAHSSYISYVGATNILTSQDVIWYHILGFSTSQPCLQHEYTTRMLLHLIPLIWYFKGLPNLTWYSQIMISLIMQLHTFLWHLRGNVSCIAWYKFCKFPRVDFFVGSPVVMILNKDKQCQIISSCPYHLYILH